MSSEHADTAQANFIKRGRPRKYPVDTIKLLKQQERKLLRLQQQLEEQKRRLHQKETHSLENKPREECSYKDFYPDLDIRKPLSVVFNSPSPYEAEKPDPLKSPILDECKTASKSKMPLKSTAPIDSRQSKLPVPSFQKDPLNNIKNDSLEPSEVQLLNTIEYDMDEQDKMWLLVLNTERKKENLGEVNADLFENIMDQLEKEWFDLIKNLPKRTNEEMGFPEDSKCAICDDGECESSNAIVFCDGCNLAVHQDCYGVPYIPEGQWLCRKCMVSPDKPVSCIFCPTEGGAFKQTSTNQWGHLLCAIWIPEVILGNSVYMEPIDSIASVPKSRWKLTCYICRRRQGACIQCDNKHCFTAFHVTCARWARLYMKMKPPNSHSEDVALKAHCDKHTPKEYKEKIDVDKSIMAAQKWFMNTKNRKGNKVPHRRYVDEELGVDNDECSLEDEKKKKKKRMRQDSITQILSRSKAARAHQHHYSAGAPVAPNYIIRNLESLKSVRESHLRKKSALIKVICKYWSLKRESKRGAPLLKRLHLEPWTASASQLKESEVETAQKASSLMSLRSDLEKVRILTEQVQKREKHKLERSRKQKAYLELILFPLEYIITPTLRQISE
ncbi:PHD-zinc-finger like domain-containing protein [Sporodiniella umbellata]|nr:PHD-zinc-finger like domain-containing protein [Sporodiniella umbellata]